MRMVTRFSRIGGPQVSLLDLHLSNGNYPTSYLNVQGRTTFNTNLVPQTG